MHLARPVPALRLPERAPVKLLAAVVAAVLAAVLLPASPAAAAKVKVDKRFFGVHDSGLGSLSRAGTGSIRLWDTGTLWRDIEVAPGVYNWTRLDQIVTAAQARNVEVTLVLGMTPSFYASVPTAMPNDPAAFYRYVTAVVQRYRSWNGKRGIHAYQVWNEANVTNFWTGTTLQMAQLTKATRNAVKAADSGAIVVSPAFAARIGEQIRGITKFAFARVDGVPAWKFADVLSLNLYPLPKYGTQVGTPEYSMQLLARARKILGYGGVPKSKPIWNTEINYGMQTGSLGGTRAATISAERQAAYVIRTYLLNAARGVKRVHWYSYNMGYLASGGTLGNTLLTKPSDGTTLTLAGKAFGLVQQWMKGTLVGPSTSTQPCTVDSRGTYTCVVKYGQGVRRVYWNPTKRVKVKVAKSATFLQGVYGVKKSVKGGSTIGVDYRPVMVRSKL